MRFGLFHPFSNGIFQTKLDIRLSGIEFRKLKRGMSSGRLICTVPGSGTYAQMQAATDILAIKGALWRTTDVGTCAALWHADGTTWRLLDVILCNGTPEGQITAPVGSLARRIDGGASTTLYVKESGVGNTGWIAK